MITLGEDEKIDRLIEMKWIRKSAEAIEKDEDISYISSL